MEQFEKALSHSSITSSSNLLDQDMLSLASSHLADGIVLAEEEVYVVGVCIEPSQPASPSHEELLDVMASATARLDLVLVQETGSCSGQTRRAIPVRP